MVELATSALLHDVGKTCIDKKLLQKTKIPDFLTKKINYSFEMEQYNYKNHPIYGHSMLNKVDRINSKVKLGILSHHENEDGTGFPFGLTGDEINEYSKIIHVCDIYDDFISNEKEEKNYSPSDALEYIMGGSGTLFDAKIVKAFKDYIPIYPKGITVLLSNGFRAIVLDNNKGNPLRPKLILEGNGQVIDLMMPILRNVTIISTDIYNKENSKIV